MPPSALRLFLCIKVPLQSKSWRPAIPFPSPAIRHPSSSCHSTPVTPYLIVKVVLEGWRIAGGASCQRKVRTPKGAMPRNSSPFDRDTRGQDASPDGQCHRKADRPDIGDDIGVRVKRCGKSAPREAQATRHGKPHRVQGQIGNPWSGPLQFRESGRVPGIGCTDK